MSAPRKNREEPEAAEDTVFFQQDYTGGGCLLFLGGLD